MRFRVPILGNPEIQTNFEQLEEWTSQRDTVVSVLPGKPSDGDEVYFQNTNMAAQGAVWHLRYRAASTSTFQWEFVGGTPYFSTRGGNITTASAAYVALTGGPTLTTPLKGDYVVDLSCGILPVTSGLAIADLFVGGTESEIALSSAVVGTWQKRAQIGKIQGVAAGATAEVRVKNENGVSTQYFNAAFSLQPSRVG